MHYNCLIVDDEEELAKMTCEYFELFDVTCAWAVTIQSAEAFLEENQVDLMLLDINLTGESGFALCKKIREKIRSSGSCHWQLPSFQGITDMLLTIKILQII